jgi:hypothetical protein
MIEKPNSISILAMSAASSNESDDDSKDIQAFSSMKRKCLDDSTRSQYASKLGQIFAWASQFDSEACDMTTKTLRMPIQASTVRLFLGYMSTKLNPRTGVVYSHSSLGSYRSAIRNAFKEASMNLDSGLLEEMSQFFGGHKRVIANKKLSGEISAVEGKQPFKYEAFVWICSEILRSTQDFELSAFSHLFCLLELNLLHRSEVVESVLPGHLRWSMDALTVVIPRHKGDPEGNQLNNSHVYSNPLTPEIDVMLSLALYIAILPFRPSGNIPSLFGQSAAGRFSKFLRSFLEKNQEELLNLFGMKLGDNGNSNLVCLFLLVSICIACLNDQELTQFEN